MTYKNRAHIDCDLMVIGAGFAGMAAAARAASLGLDTVQAGSSSGFFLASGLMDFLGTYPLDPLTRVESLNKGLEAFKKDFPDHPYSKISFQKTHEAFEFISQFLSNAGLEYQCGENRNFQILTAAGTFKPSFCVPKTIVKSSVLFESKKDILLVDFKGLKGYSAKLIAESLEKKGHNVKTLTIDIPDFTGDFNVTRLAGKFEDDDFIKYLADQIKGSTHAKGLLGLPAVCGISNALTVQKKIENLTNLKCFEIPGLPPSIPGVRLKNAFEKQLSKSNVHMLSNANVKFNAFKDKSLVFDAQYQNINARIHAKGVILATGRFPGGGLKANRGLISETLFNIPVDQPEQRSLWYDADFFHPKGHGINRAGLLTDENFRPIDGQGRVVFDTLYSAGSILGHNDWVRLKSGAGVSLVSAICAVEHFYDVTRFYDTIRGQNV